MQVVCSPNAEMSTVYAQAHKQAEIRARVEQGKNLSKRKQIALAVPKCKDVDLWYIKDFKLKNTMLTIVHNKQTLRNTNSAK